MTHQRILIVDDDQDFRESLSEVLTRRGFRVDHAAGTSEALDKLRSEAFQVALIDVVMPGRDGIACMDEILKGQPDTRVMIMTGFAVPERQQLAMELGAACIIHKPIDIPRLIESVNRFCAAPTALVAHGDRSELRRVKSGLERRAFNVVTADSAGVLTERLADGSFAMVVLDLGLVGAALADVLGALRSRARPVRVVLCNAAAAPQALAAMTPDPHLDAQVVPGPFDRSALLSVVDALLSPPPAEPTA